MDCMKGLFSEMTSNVPNTGRDVKNYSNTYACIDLLSSVLTSQLTQNRSFKDVFPNQPLGLVLKN